MSPEPCPRKKEHSTSSVFCYGGEKGRSGCRGDSGSPLMVTRDTGTGQTQYRYHSTVQYSEVQVGLQKPMPASYLGLCCSLAGSVQGASGAKGGCGQAGN